MANNAFTIFGSIFLDAKDTMKKLDQVGDGFDKTFEKAGSKSGEFVSNVGKNISTIGNTILGASTAIGGYAMNLYMPYEDSMAKIRTLVGDDEIFDGLKTNVLNLSSELGMDAAAVGQAMYDGLSSGVSPENIADFTEKMGKLAKGGFTEVATATDVVTTALNAYGLGIENVDRISDILITTQNKGKTTVDQLASSLGQVIPIASANNVEIEQLGASYAILTANGISTAESGTKLKSMFDELSATGSDVDEILKEVGGMSFKQMMENGYDTADALKILEKYAADNDVTMNDLFGSTEAASAAMILAKDNGNQFKESLDAMKNSAGAANDNFETVDNTLSSKLAKSVETIKNAFIKLGEKLVPIIEEKIVPIIEKFTDWVGNLSDESLDNAAKWVEWGIKVGGVLAVGGKVTGWIGNIMQLVDVFTGSGKNGIVGGTKAAGDALGNFGKIGGLLSSPTGWVALGIGAVVGLTTAFIDLQNQLDDNQVAFEEAMEAGDNFTGSLRSNESVWTQIFGKKWDITFSAEYKKEREETEKELALLNDDIERKLKEANDIIKNGQPSNEDNATDYNIKNTKQYAEAVEIEKRKLDEIIANRDKAVELYKNNLEDLGIEDTKYIEESSKKFEDWYIGEQQQYASNATEIRKIQTTALEERRELTDDELTKIQELEKENARIITDTTTKNIDDLVTAYEAGLAEAEGGSLRHKALNRKTLEEIKADRKKATKEFSNNIDAEIKKLQDRNDHGDVIKNKLIDRLNQQRRNYEEYGDRFAEIVEAQMESTGNLESSINTATEQIIADFGSQLTHIQNWDKGTAASAAGVIASMMDAGWEADDLKRLIELIPKEWRSEVIANVSGKYGVDELDKAVRNLQSKDVWITAHYTAKFQDTGTATVAYQQMRNGRFGNDYTMYSRAHGEESFMPKTPKKAFAAGNEGFIPETEIVDANNNSFMPKDTLTKAIGGAVGNARSVLVGEQGPELVQLPQGAKVKTHRETNNIINKTEPQIIQVVLDGKVIAQAIAPYTGKALADRVNKERW